MQENKEFLGTAPIGKLLFKLSLPTVMAQMINMLYNIVDRIYIDNGDPNCGTPEEVSAEVKKLAEPVADVIAVCFTAVLFVIQFKKAMKKLERPLEA